MTPPDISQLNGRFGDAQLLAAGVLALIIIAILVAMGVLNRRAFDSAAAGVSPKSRSGDVPKEAMPSAKRWNLLVGLDNRASTSRTVALLWTLVVSFCLLTLTFVALSPISGKTPTPSGYLPPGWISAAFQPLGPTYLVALGAPLAAALLARGIVSSRTASGTVQKSTAASASVLDLVTDDSGDLDLVDLQYTLFNVISAVFVVTQFSLHAPRGFVAIPPALATLSGLSAAVYTGNKLAVTNPPRLDRVLTPNVAPGDKVEVVGSNLLVSTSGGDPGADARDTLVTLSNAKHASPPAFEATAVTSSKLEFSVPAGIAVADGWDITVRTNAGGTAILYRGLNIVAAAPENHTARSAEARTFSSGSSGASTNGTHVGGIGLPVQ